MLNQLNIVQSVSSPYHNQSKSQVEAYIKLLKQMFKRCMDTNVDSHIALIQIRSTLTGQSLPSPVTVLLK